MYFKLFVALISVYGLLSLAFLGYHSVGSTETTNATLWRRFKRQALPVEHLKIHSIQSNITINGANIEAISSESIIGLQKEPYNATVFSRHSNANFDSNGTFVQISAQSLDFALLFQKMIFRSMANNGDLEMRVNNQATNQSMLRLRMAENVQFGLTDEQSLLRILSSNATQISLTAATDQQKLPRQLQLGYDNVSDVFKIQFTEDQSRVSVEISRSVLHINYGNIFLQMDNNYRRLIILTSGHRLEFHTLGSLFQLQLDQQGMSVIYPHDNVRVHASSNSKNVSVDVDTLSKMNIRHTEDSRVSLKGSNFTNTSINNLEVLSARMNLNLYADNDSLIMATTNQSRLTLNSSSANFLLASTIHQIEIIGNKPFLMATTENVALVITSINGKQIQVPNITVPNVDYNRYNLQNLTQLDSLAPNATWLTSKINMADLIGEDIVPIQNFSNVIGAQQYNGTSGSVTIPPIIINTAAGTTKPAVLPTLFPAFSTLAPLGSTQSLGQTQPLGQTQVTTAPSLVQTQPTIGPEIPQITPLPGQETTLAPEVTQPSFTFPNVNPPDLTQPPLTGQETTLAPIVNPPELTQPPITNPDLTQPPLPGQETTLAPEVTQPSFTFPNVNPPDLTQPPLLGQETTLAPIVNPPEVTQLPITNPDLTQPPLPGQETTLAPIVNPPEVTQPPITNPDLTQAPSDLTQAPTNPPSEGQQTANPDLTQAPTSVPSENQQTANQEQSVTTLIPNLPPDFPTPSTLSQAIAETGFPMPPLNVDSMNDGPQTIVTTAQPSNNGDNFVFGQFETQPPIPIEATIVNVSLSVTTPMPI